MRMGAKDIDRVWRVLSHPSIYGVVSDEPLPDGYRNMIAALLANPYAYILSPDPDCVFPYMPRNEICYEVHSNVLPEARGKRGFKAGLASLEYMFSETPCMKVVGFTATCFVGAHLFNRHMGLIQEGLSKSSKMKDGVLYDEVIYGLTRKDWRRRHYGQSA